jgi:hypothetical protein
MRDRCETCRFWKKPWSEKDHEGGCRRFPPVATAYQSGGFMGGEQRLTIWPQTSSQAWCGEYQAGGGATRITRDGPRKPLVEVGRPRRTVTVRS